MDILGWSAGVALVTVALVSVMDIVARGRSAAFRHALWAVGVASLVVTPALLALAGWAAARPANAGAAPIASWTGAEPPAALSWLGLAWAIPATLLALRSAGGWFLAARLARRAAPLPLREWQAEAEASARRLGLSRAPSVAVTDAVAGPAVVGVVRPVLLVPPQALAAPASYRRAILDHELAHIARRDVLVTRVSALARALHWYNPLVWIAVARLDLAAECACDDAVLMGGLSPWEYARILTRTIGAPTASPVLAGAGFGTAPIVKRVEALAARKRARRSLAPRDRWALAGALLLALAPLAAASVTLAHRSDRSEVLIIPEEAAFIFTEGTATPGLVAPR